MRRLAFFTALVAIGSAAHAGDKVLIQPTPAWVKPAPAIDTAKLTDAAPILLVFDNQQKLEGGQVWSYTESATRAASPQVLSAIGTIQLPWQPAQGDLIVHMAEIIRGSEHIDLLKSGAQFTVLRREQQLDQRMLDGMLTATMPVSGLSVGDVVHLMFSVTRKDPTLKGDLQAFAPLLSDPVRVQFARARLIWPEASDVRWKAYSDGVDAKPVTAGGYRDLTIAMPLLKQPEIPTDAPLRFQRIPLLEATTFADWAAVSKVMAPLYATDGLIVAGSPLAAEVARIEKANADPLARAALALQLVQDKIRYLLLGMDTGNYVPQVPAQTWSARYGDCKAKALLLLSILHALKIEAEPVLANIKLGRLVPERLPAPSAFDHVLVHATIGGKDYWLDGTGQGSRLADIADTPPFGTVLPVRARGAVLMPIVPHANARADLDARVELDESAGIDLPTPFKATIVLRGPQADAIRVATAQAGKDDITTFAETLVKPYVDSPALVTRDIAFDDTAGTATVVVTGIAYPDWSAENRRMKIGLDRIIGPIDFKPDRARAAWRTIPVKTDDPTRLHLVTRVKLPGGGKGFTIEGAPTYSGTLAGSHVDRVVTQQGEWVATDDTVTTTGLEIAAADIPAERQRVAVAKSQLPRIAAAADYPPEWQGIAAGAKDRRFDPVIALYTRRIADDPAKRDRWTDRAWAYERLYRRREAIADLDRAIAIEPDADTYLRRAALYQSLAEDQKALADAEAALKLDPSSTGATVRLAGLRADTGDGKTALALVQERIDAGGKDAADFMDTKADLQARTGDSAGAIATIDAAIADKPGSPSLLNARCWIKGTRNLALDTALKDCAKAIELSGSTSDALDSRAMVYFRLNRLDEALTDLDAVLEDDPGIAGSLYMRGIIERRLGKTAAADLDLTGARTIDPRIDKTYARFGIAP